MLDVPLRTVPLASVVEDVGSSVYSHRDKVISQTLRLSLVQEHPSLQHAIVLRYGAVTASMKLAGPISGSPEF